MIAWDKHVSNSTIYSEIWIQKKAHWDPNGMLDDLSLKTYMQLLSRKKNHGRSGLMFLTMGTIVTNQKIWWA